MSESCCCLIPVVLLPGSFLLPFLINSRAIEQFSDNACVGTRTKVGSVEKQIVISREGKDLTKVVTIPKMTDFKWKVFRWVFSSRVMADCVSRVVKRVLGDSHENGALILQRERGMLTCNRAWTEKPNCSIDVQCWHLDEFDFPRFWGKLSSKGVVRWCMVDFFNHAHVRGSERYSRIAWTVANSLQIFAKGETVARTVDSELVLLQSKFFAIANVRKTVYPCDV